MSIDKNKLLVTTKVLGHIFELFLKQLSRLVLGLGALLISSVASTDDNAGVGSKKIKDLGEYQIQLVCDPKYYESESERCEIVITDPNSLDQSKATLNLPHNYSSNTIPRNSGQNSLEPKSFFSSEALDKKEKSQEILRHKYRISRDWLFRMKITEDGKEPDISILSIIVPNDEKNKY